MILDSGSPRVSPRTFVLHEGKIQCTKYFKKTQGILKKLKEYSKKTQGVEKNSEFWRQCASGCLPQIGQKKALP